MLLWCAVAVHFWRGSFGKEGTKNGYTRWKRTTDQKEAWLRGSNPELSKKEKENAKYRGLKNSNPTSLIFDIQNITIYRKIFELEKRNTEKKKYSLTFSDKQLVSLTFFILEIPEKKIFQFFELSMTREHFHIMVQFICAD